MEEPKEIDKCLARLNKRVGECFYNQIGKNIHQRKAGELLCSHCYVISSQVVK